MVKMMFLVDGANAASVPEIIIRQFDLIKFDMDVAIAKKICWLGKIDISFVGRENCREVAGNNLHSETANLENAAIDGVFRSMMAIRRNLFFPRGVRTFKATLPARIKMTCFSNLC
jgi:hypothetical protein